MISSENLNLGCSILNFLKFISKTMIDQIEKVLVNTKGDLASFNNFTIIYALIIQTFMLKKSQAKDHVIFIFRMHAVHFLV